MDIPLMLTYDNHRIFTSAIEEALKEYFKECALKINCQLLDDKVDLIL